MKKVTDKATEARILDYIRPHLGECIYLYIDVSVYGIDSPFLDLWYDEDEDGICFVVMRYHDSLQIYSHKDDWDKGALMDIIREYDIQAVNAKGSMLDALDEELGDSYEKRTGWILKGKSMANLKVDGLMEVEVAGVEDTEEIAELMHSNVYRVAFNAMQGAIRAELREPVIMDAFRWMKEYYKDDKYIPSNLERIEGI